MYNSLNYFPMRIRAAEFTLERLETKRVIIIYVILTMSNLSL